MLFFKFDSPWILSRKKVIASIVIDTLLYCVFFFGTFFYRETYQLSFILNQIFIFVLWLLISYLIGRYHIISNYRLKKAYFNFLLTSISFIIFYFSVNLISTFFINLQLLSNFFLRFILFLSINFLFINLFIIFIKRRNYKNYKSIFIGNKYILDSIDSDLIRKRFEVCEISNEKFNKKFKNNYDYIIVEKMEELPQNIYQKLINYRKKNKSIITLFDWCELYLERLPSFLITKTDLIKGILNSKKNIERRIKRLGDFIFSLLLLIISAPVILISTFLIFLEDRGPIFYRQVRTGKDGKFFRITKLRTMKVNAETKGPQWSKKNDQRITMFGYYLRKLRIDELPQLISVLKGEMSLIGPRPERPIIEKKLIKKIPNYSLRYSIRPGLSGWAQVNYPYGASIKDSEKKLSYDFFYIKNFSIFLDILIFIKTIKLVFNAKGAISKN
tara:strand:- start:27 stop:1358 length:1332 start_codon:yes stop_codon:yes gene_type:complete